MTRADLIDRISAKVRLSKPRAELLVDTVFGRVKESLLRGEKVELRGFGTFQVRNYQAYAGRNPRTGAIVEVGPKRLPHFKTSPELVARIDRRTGR